MGFVDEISTGLFLLRAFETDKKVNHNKSEQNVISHHLTHPFQKREGKSDDSDSRVRLVGGVSPKRQAK